MLVLTIQTPKCCKYHANGDLSSKTVRWKPPQPENGKKKQKRRGKKAKKIMQPVNLLRFECCLDGIFLDDFSCWENWADFASSHFPHCSADPCVHGRKMQTCMSNVAGLQHLRLCCWNSREGAQCAKFVAIPFPFDFPTNFPVRVDTNFERCDRSSK